MEENKTHLVYIIKIPIYFGRLRIIFSDDISKANEDLKLGMQADLTCFGAIVIGDRTPKGLTRYTMLFDKKPMHAEIAHEAVHAVNWLFKDRAIELDRINDEPQAYLTGFFVGHVYKAMKKFGIKCYEYDM